MMNDDWLDLIRPTRPKPFSILVYFTPYLIQIRPLSPQNAHLVSPYILLVLYIPLPDSQ